LSAELAKPDHTGFAISMILLGTVIITASDLIAKSVIPHVSIWQLLFLRSLLGLSLLIPLLFFLKKLKSIHTLNLKAVLSRSVLMSACYLCFYIALANIPIALLAGAFFCGPFFMVLLSRLMLGEKFGIWRSFSLIAGFIGVLLVLQPNSQEFEPLLLLGLVSAFFYALTQVVTRKYCKNEKPIAISYWLTVTFLVTGLVGMIFLWFLPSLSGESFFSRPSGTMPLLPFLLLSFMSVCSIAMHFALSAAYQNAPSSLIAPLEYLYLPLAMLGGYFFYDEIPNLTAIIGIIIIITAGLIVAWRKDA